MAEREQKQLARLEWDDVEELPTVYANHVAVTHASGDEFYLIFGEASPPNEMLRQGEVRRVPIRPVAKIAVSPGSMARVATAIYQNYQNYFQKTSAAEEPDAEPTH